MNHERPHNPKCACASCGADISESGGYTYEEIDAAALAAVLLEARLIKQGVNKAIARGRAHKWLKEQLS